MRQQARRGWQLCARESLWTLHSGAQLRPNDFTYSQKGVGSNHSFVSRLSAQNIWGATTEVGCAIVQCSANTPFSSFPKWTYVRPRMTKPRALQFCVRECALVSCFTFSSVFRAPLCVRSCVNTNQPAIMPARRPFQLQTAPANQPVMREDVLLRGSTTACVMSQATAATARG